MGGMPGMSPKMYDHAYLSRVCLSWIQHLGYEKLATLELTVERPNDYRQLQVTIPHTADNQTGTGCHRMMCREQHPSPAPSHFSEAALTTI